MVKKKIKKKVEEVKEIDIDKISREVMNRIAIAFDGINLDDFVVNKPTQKGGKKK